MSTTDLIDRRSRLSAAKQALLAQRVESKLDGPRKQEIVKRARLEGLAALSLAQQWLWLLDQLEPGASRYNMSIVVRLTGRLDQTSLNRSLNEIVARHEILRTTFRSIDGAPVQVVGPPVLVTLNVEDRSASSEKDREAWVQAIASEEAAHQFDLTRGPLLRARLLRLKASEHVIVLTMHHIVSDGWSLGVLVSEVAALYKSFTEGRPSQLPDLFIQYADFAEWQREWLNGEVLEKQLGYWKQQLAAAPELLELPADRPRPPVKSFQGSSHSVALSSELSESLKLLSRRERVTLFMSTLAAWQTLLLRYSGQTDLIVGTPIANRNRSETEGLIGFFVNTLVLRTDLSGNPTFRDLLERVRDVTLSAYANQDLPFERLVEELQPARSLSYTPLIQAMFILQNTPLGALELPGLVLSPVEIERQVAKLDLILDLAETSEGLRGVIEYSSDLFDRSTIVRIISHFENVLRAVIVDPSQRLMDLPLLSEAETTQLLIEWNQTRQEYEKTAGIHELFEMRASNSPDAAAVVSGSEQLSYGALDAASNRLAYYLRTLNVGSEAPAAICMDRSIEMIVAMLGVLKTGAAYVPLDPRYPTKLLAYMLEDSQASVIVTKQSFTDALPQFDGRIVCVDADAELDSFDDGELTRSALHAETLAYVMYTSGSTGNPKGVAVTHQDLIWLVNNLDDLTIEAPDIVAHASNTAFDAASFEVWGALSSGARLSIVPRDVLLSPVEFVEHLRSQEVSVLYLTAALFARMASHDPTAFSTLRRVVYGGESIDPHWAKTVIESAPPDVLIHVYGPTETTVFSSYHIVTGQGGGVALPIGWPMSNTSSYILDECMRPVPIGVVGELYIGGEGLARGYLNRPDQTASRFIPNPYACDEGDRLYRTGDLARYLANGETEFAGRTDRQVKVRGFRIELEEVENAILQHPGVVKTVVSVRKDNAGDKRLAAYIVEEGEARGAFGELRRFLRERLPEFMIPSAFVAIDSIPLTLNGKLDRAALPEPAWSTASEDSEAPVSPLEEMIRSIWCDVLGIESIGIHESFFDAGGHSLSATQLISRVRGLFKIELPLRDFFAAPTIGQLALKVRDALDGGRLPDAPELRRVERDRPLPLSFAQQRLWFMDQLEPNTARYNISIIVHLSGQLNIEALERAFSKVVQRHEVLRTSFISVEGTPAQVIREQAALPLPMERLDEKPADEREAETKRLTREEALKPFDLEAGPLLRGRLLHFGEQEHLLILTMHHIVSDGWSMGVMVKEVAELYGEFASGKPSSLPELEIQYADFAVWQREWLQGEVLEKQLDYWRDRLAGAASLLELPADRPRQSNQTQNGASLPISVRLEITEALKALSRGEGVTLFMTLLAVFQTLLYRYTNRTDIIVGADVANRTHKETEPLIGFFVNMLVLRTNLSGRPTFTELLGRVREVALGAYANQYVPFEKIVEEFEPVRSMSHTPLFQVVFALQNAPIGTLELPGLILTLVDIASETAKFDLLLDLTELEGGLKGIIEYNTDLFEARTIERMGSHFERLLESVVENPECAIDELRMLTASERDEIVVDWNAAEAEFPKQKCIHELIEEQAEKTPGAVAVEYGGETISYAELQTLSDRIAGKLEELGASNGERVGLYLEHSIWTIAAILGVLKAGSAYVPIDVNHPAKRREYIVSDAEIKVMLTESRHKETVSGVRTVAVDEEWAELRRGLHRTEERYQSKVQPSDVAYVIYTSGSTGEPKGVEIQHRALVNYVWWAAKMYVDEGTKQDFALYSSLAFDLTVTSIYTPLITGNRIVVYRGRGAEVIQKILEDDRVEVLKLTPSHLRVIKERRNEGSRIKRLIVGGEALETKLAREVYESFGREVEIINEYGPTEATVGCMIYRYRAE
ncbi:MAG: non-ribosomal peptide synthetase, partial [Blastocatellia bacterium AA13]